MAHGGCCKWMWIVKRHRIQDIYDLLLTTPAGLTTCQIAEALIRPVEEVAIALTNSARNMKVQGTRGVVPPTGGTVNTWRATAITGDPCRCWTCPTQRRTAA